MNARKLFWTALVLAPFLISAQSTDSVSSQTQRSLVVLVEEDDYVNVSEDDHFITLGLFNGSGFIQYRCYYSDRSAFRLGLSGRLTSTFTETTPPSEPSESTTTTSRILDLSMGVQTAFLKSDRLESYVALDLSPGYEASATETRTSEYAAGEYQYTTVRKTEEPFLNVRLVPVIGANLYVYKGLSVGVEYRMSMISYRRQMGYEEKVHTEDANGQTISDPVTYNFDDNRDSSTLTAGFNGTAFVTVGLRLNR